MEEEPPDVAWHRLKRAVRGALAAGAAAAMVTLAPAPATADPDLPDNAPDAVRQLRELSHRAEQLTEQWHEAKDQLTARQVELGKARSDLAAAAEAAQAARAQEGQFRGQVDQLTNASFQGVRLDQLAALLVSESPQQFLDEMSALDMLAADNQESMEHLVAIRDRAEAAQQAATAAEARSRDAETRAAVTEAEIGRRKAEMDRQVARVQAQLDSLSEADRAAYTSEGEIDFVAGPASGVGGAAMRAALSQQGKPYSWGADGPGSYDCSGLTSWAFRKAGVRIPRSSRAQAGVGRPVSRSGLRPGDLVFFYSPISHVGIYVGGGKMVHAPNSGDVVKVSPIDREEFSTARRKG